MDKCALQLRGRHCTLKRCMTYKSCLWWNKLTKKLS